MNHRDRIDTALAELPTSVQVDQFVRALGVSTDIIYRGYCVEDLRSLLEFIIAKIEKYPGGIGSANILPLEWAACPQIAAFITVLLHKCGLTYYVPELHVDNSQWDLTDPGRVSTTILAKKIAAICLGNIIEDETAESCSERFTLEADDNSITIIPNPGVLYITEHLQTCLRLWSEDANDYIGMHHVCILGSPHVAAIVISK